MRLRPLILSLLACVALIAPPAPADAGEMAEVTLLPGWRGTDGVHVAGLRIRLAPGWKTYWRAPGEAGIPPHMDWSGSRNLRAAETLFPAPSVIESGGLRTIGYAGEVVLPLRLTPRDASAPIRLQGDIELGICEEICVPMTVTIRAELPASGGRDVAIAAAIDAVPKRIRAGADCAFAPISDGMRVTARTGLPAGLGQGTVGVVELGDPTVWVSETLTEARGGGLSLTADLVPPRGRPLVLDRSALRVTLIGPSRTVELSGCN